MNRRVPDRSDRDRGALMGITLFMCLILAAASFALVDYLRTALRASDVYEAQVRGAASVEAALQVSIDALHGGAGQCRPTMDVPSTNGSVVRVTCEQAGSSPRWSRHRLVATVTVGGGTSTGSAVVQIPTWTGGVPCTQSCSLVVNSWSLGT